MHHSVRDTYPAELPFLVLGYPGRLTRGKLDEEGLCRVKVEAVHFVSLDEAGRDGRHAGREKGGSRELHCDGLRKVAGYGD
jgi:hypothetical protein